MALWGLTPDLATPLDEQLAGLARAHRILAHNGHADISLGHLCLRDPKERGFWLKVKGLALEEVAGPADFVLLDWDGERLSGPDGRRHLEWPIHAEILRARPDVHVVAHTHPTYASAFSATSAEIQALTHEGNFVEEKIAYYRRMPGLITTPELGRELAATLGGKFVVLMKNHGVTTCAPTIAGAALLGIFTERASRVQLLAEASRLSFSGPSPSEPGARLELGPGLVADFWDTFLRHLARRESSAR